MSRIHFLADQSKTSPLENENIFSISSVHHSRQHWRQLVQRIINDDYHEELKNLQSKLNHNIFEHRTTNEYAIEENERVYKVHASSFRSKPNRATIGMTLVRLGSVLQYREGNARVARTIMIQNSVEFEIPLRLSEVEDLFEFEQKMFLKQKLVTIVPPSQSTITTSKSLILSTSSKVLETSISIEGRHAFFDDESTLLLSPKWRPALDESEFPLLDSRSQPLIPLARRPSDDFRQMMMQTVRLSSKQDGSIRDRLGSFGDELPLLSFTNPSSSGLLFFQRRLHRPNLATDHPQDAPASRFSVQSISYGFGLGTKHPPPTIAMDDRQKHPHESIIFSPSEVVTAAFRLPSNKIELDSNQQEAFRLAGSFKRTSDTI